MVLPKLPQSRQKGCRYRKEGRETEEGQGGRARGRKGGRRERREGGREERRKA